MAHSEHHRLISERDRLYIHYRRLRFHTDLQRYRTARDHTHNIIETAKLIYYHNRLTKLTDSRKIWKELKNLGICATRSNYGSAFSSEDLNQHFGGIAYDPDEQSGSDFLRNLPCDEEFFPNFEFKEVSLGDAKLAIVRSASQARGSDGIPQTVILAAFPVVGSVICRIFNDSLRKSVFPSI